MAKCSFEYIKCGDHPNRTKSVMGHAGMEGTWLAERINSWSMVVRSSYAMRYLSSIHSSMVAAADL